MNKTFKEAFKVTMPVLLGYLSIGFAFGLMIQSIGLNFIWAGGMSPVSYTHLDVYKRQVLNTSLSCLAAHAIL